MRILWVTNVGLPEAYMLMGEHPSHFGGWLVNSAFVWRISKVLSYLFRSHK